MKIFLAVCYFALTSLATVTPPPQDANFRLLNLERRCDQQQQRIDALERQLQNQSLAGIADPNRELMIEMQRQQLSLNQHLLTLQQQQLELKKAFDQQTARLQELEKRAAGSINETKPASENKPAPKPTPRRP